MHFAIRVNLVSCPNLDLEDPFFLIEVAGADSCARFGSDSSCLRKKARPGPLSVRISLEAFSIAGSNQGFMTAEGD